ncbi:hypothetical protein G5B37_09465 [Rasiella rasia]|uniref:Uncharacterized protein n=1 Tax=Rasiella rasia TaxID=2744027 RepID=A0A6G6GMK0_9FLAO|nr:contractile injection system tape measure protein [Rasiella rasia]QIE59782.1 hypothetical protein G5B37_09465 [Rasiella rasia]
MEQQFLNPEYVRHAGLIITAPFLALLFSRLELTQNNEFINSSSQHRAVQLLNYVASGAEENLEYELVAHKILCGMQPNEPLITGTPLTHAEKEVADDMLMAITQQWTALNTTSKQGLRETFIMRDGIIEDDENAFYLKVEQKAFDVLLDQIPWDIGRIKLSWMHKILEVTWR